MSERDLDGLPTPRRYWAAAAIWLALAMAVLDSSIVNIALPTIADELGATPAASIWVLNAYQIAITMLLLPIAALGETLGTRRVYVGGLLLFVSASLACTFANTLTTLALARFAQGFGAAAVMAINGALVRHTYPLKTLGRGIGYNALVVAISSAAGPTAAAAILALGSWRWLFAVNVPLGLLAFALGRRHLPEVAGRGGRIDVAAAALNVVMFGAIFLAATDAAHGVFDLRSGVELVVAVVAGTTLVRRGRGQAAPLIPLDLLRIPLLRLSYAASVCAFAAQVIGLVALPFSLLARGYDQVAVGLLISAWPLATCVAAPVAGRIGERVPSGLLGGIGLCVMATGFAALALLGGGRDAAWLAIAMACCGAGFGLFQTPNNRTMLGTAPPGRSGAAGAMLAVARLTGQTSGAVVVALLFRLDGPAGRATYLTAAGLTIVAALFSLRRLGAK